MRGLSGTRRTFNLGRRFKSSKSPDPASLTWVRNITVGIGLQYCTRFKFGVGGRIRDLFHSSVSDQSCTVLDWNMAESLQAEAVTPRLTRCAVKLALSAASVVDPILSRQPSLFPCPATLQIVAKLWCWTA
jgi:hypothetical protein